MARKMSKSYGNTILLSDPEPVVRAKLKTMVTDPARIRREGIPATPMCAPSSTCTSLLRPLRLQQDAREGCMTAGIGCIDIELARPDNLVRGTGPYPRAAAYPEQHPPELDAILEDGNARANVRANQSHARSALP